ncbi:uncharacterized protein [Acropora muricata]|uniref:uncharacterized protein n=1 Tax=Acropora muricata TaxID=159855 RepID=UPI0034E4047A
MKRFWLCAVGILTLCNLSHSDVCRGFCSCYNDNYGHYVDCEGRGVNSTSLLNMSFPTYTHHLSLSNNEITQLPENVFSGLRYLLNLFDSPQQRRNVEQPSPRPAIQSQCAARTFPSLWLIIQGGSGL